MRALAVTIVMLYGAAGAASAETLTQHHQWARKFERVADPVATGSIGIRPDVDVRTGAPACPSGATRFGDLPFESWRVVRCEGPMDEAGIPL